MRILTFPGHKWAHCTNPSCTGCHLCHGGLAQCVRCGLGEGSLTTDCPGYRTRLGDLIYDGRVDYRGGGWVFRTSPHSPAYYRQGARR